MTNFLRSYRSYLANVFEFITYLLTIVTLVGIVSGFVQWGREGPFSSILEFLATNILVIWLVTITMAVLVLWMWTSRLHRRFVRGFSDNFKGLLEENWDIVGPWRIIDNGTLKVTGSDEGGITKHGAQWENYIYSFRARIIKDCLGVVVRAQDLNNYYMFQIGRDKINPHRRISVPVVMSDSEKSEEKKSLARPVGYFVGWQTIDNTPEFKSVPIEPKLEGWFECKIIVKGQSIKICINNESYFDETSFLHIPTGKVGFRNHGSEEAQVKYVRVTLLQ